MYRDLSMKKMEEAVIVSTINLKPGDVIVANWECFEVVSVTFDAVETIDLTRGHHYNDGIGRKSFKHHGYSRTWKVLAE